MVCRARAGQTAPEIGTPLDISSGLSGECVRSRRMLRCHDTESDGRVDLAACRHLGVRSIVVLPVLLEQQIVGVFEVFSPQSDAFGDAEIAALESMLDLIVSVVRPAPAPPLEKSASVTTAEAPLSARRETPSNSVVESQVSPTSVKIFGQDFEISEPNLRRSSGNENLDDEFLSSIAAPKTSKHKLFGRTRKNFSPQKENLGSSVSSVRVDVVERETDDDLLCEIETLAKNTLPGPVRGLGTFAAGDPEIVPTSERWVSRKLIVASCVAILLGLMWLAWGSRSADPVPLPDPPPPAELRPENVPSGSNKQTMPEATATSPSAAVEPDPLPPPAAEKPKLDQPLPGKLTKSLIVDPTVTRPAHNSATHTNSKESKAPLARQAKTSIASDKSEESGPSPAAVAPPANLPLTANGGANPASANPSEAAATSPPATPPKQNSGRGIDLSQGVVSDVGVPASSNSNDANVLGLLQASARAGDPNAQLALAVRYAEGNGVRQSYSESMKWFAKAEAQGVFPQDSKAKDARKRAAQMGH